LQRVVRVLVELCSNDHMFIVHEIRDDHPIARSNRKVSILLVVIRHHALQEERVCNIVIVDALHLQQPTLWVSSLDENVKTAIFVDVVERC